VAWPDPRRDRALLLAWLAASFALSAASDLRWLGAAALASAALLRRGLGRNLRRVLLSVAPLAALLAAASWAVEGLAAGRLPAAAPYLALVLRASLLGFLALAVLERVDLLAALAPWPTATRLLVIALAQVHALRLLATESLLGLRSRLPRKPGAGDVLRGAGAVTGALLALSLRNARDVADALRARGFE
jgi:cobalt/nickel transport system permease protein